ncbi:MAG: sodium:solute symporter, partial [Candidatus Kapaibacterium sp.]
MMFTPEITVVIASLVAVHVAGMLGSRRGRNDFVLAERSMSQPLLVATLVATWYGAILASGEFVIRHGVVFLLCFGLPYYVVAVVYAGWLSKRVREGMSASIPEQIGRVHGPRARRVATILLLVITVPASYQLMAGYILSNVTGLSLGVSIIVGTIFSVSYVTVGGLRSDAYANVVQVVLMFGGMILLAIASMMTFGGPELLSTAHTRPLFDIPGSLGWAGIASWWVIAMQTFIDPNIYVRAASASSISVARKAILWSVVCWIVFDLLQLITGLYAARYVPETNPAVAYLTLSGVVLPEWGRGLVLAGIIAAVTSTLSGYALVSASTIADEILPMLREIVVEPPHYFGADTLAQGAYMVARAGHAEAGLELLRPYMKGWEAWSDAERESRTWLIAMYSFCLEFHA